METEQEQEFQKPEDKNRFSFTYKVKTQVW